MTSDKEAAEAYAAIHAMNAHHASSVIKDFLAGAAHARAETQAQHDTLKFDYQTAKRQAAENGEAYSLCKQERDALKAENEQLRIQFKRADLFGLEAILESEQLFKRSCEKLKLERDALEAENDRARAAHKYELGCQQSIALKLHAQAQGLVEALEGGSPDYNSAWNLICLMAEGEGSDATVYQAMAKAVHAKLKPALAALKAQRGRDD